MVPFLMEWGREWSDIMQMQTHLQMEVSYKKEMLRQ